MSAITGSIHWLVISPGVAKIIARDGWKKNDIKMHLYINAEVSMKLLEKHAWQIGYPELDLCARVKKGLLPTDYCQSNDPERLVPVFVKPEWIGIVVSGDPGRNQSKGFVQNHKQGPPVSKKVVFPNDWRKLLNETKIQKAPSG